LRQATQLQANQRLLAHSLNDFNEVINKNNVEERVIGRVAKRERGLLGINHLNLSILLNLCEYQSQRKEILCP